MPVPGPLGLPDSIRVCLFDLDGVLTRTATVHFAAWKRTFDDFLEAHDPGAGEFSQADYNRFVDGKPRADGVRDFLASRGITLPEGPRATHSTRRRCTGIATRKNELVLHELEEHGVEVYPGSVRYLQAVKEAGLATAVVTASANGEKVIGAGGFADLIDVRVDGWPSPWTRRLGKPEPDTFLAAAGCSASSQPRRWSSRTRWPAWRRVGRAPSATWWGRRVGAGRRTGRAGRRRRRPGPGRASCLGTRSG